MRVFTGDAIGSVKVSDIVAKTVELVSKPTVPSRQMAVDYLEAHHHSEEGQQLLLIGRTVGLVEYFDVQALKPLYICPVPGGSVIFCSLIRELQLLAVVTQKGWLILVDHEKLKNEYVEVKLASSSSSDEDPLCAWVEEFLTQYSDWTDERRRPAWVRSALCVFTQLKEESEYSEDDPASPTEAPADDRITSAFSFIDAEGKICLGLAGYTCPLTVYQYEDGKGLIILYKTTHSGRIFGRDRRAKIMACGYLGEVAELPAAYTVDQRGKCRIYFLRTNSVLDEGRETGPIITFQMTLDNTCPNMVKLMSDEYHYKVLDIVGETDEGDGSGADDESVASTTAFEGEEVIVKSEDLEAEERRIESNFSSEDETPCDEGLGDEGSLKRLESHLLASTETHSWLFGIGDAKGGAYVIRVTWDPSSEKSRERLREYEKTGHLEEYYDRTKIRRRMRVNVIYKIGQLIDTSPLDRGDRKRHEAFRAAIAITVQGSFKGIPGAINSIEYVPERCGASSNSEARPEMVCLAGLSRRLYVFIKDGLGRWKQAYKINLKNKITSAATAEDE